MLVTEVNQPDILANTAMRQSMLTTDAELIAANAQLEGASPQDVIAWALALDMPPLVTTTFGDHSAVLLHLVTQVDAQVPVLWVDTGYNTSATYRFADRLIDQLKLNIKIYSPRGSSARRNVQMGGIPDVTDPLHSEFTRQVKLEPFKRALSEIQPEVWFTGVRSEQTEFRRSLPIVSRTKENYLKVAPLLHWSERQMDEYLELHGLPNEADYFDPTKAQESRECGLHTTL